MDNPIIQALRRARQAYMTNVGEPTAQLVGGGVRGYLGLDAPDYADSRGMEAYRNAQALGNAPGVGAPAGAFKTAAKVVPETAMFIGALAKTWDKASNAKAVEMEKAGADAREIWRETGNLRGADGKWRQEIDDSVSRFNVSMRNGEKVENDLTHGMVGVDFGPTVGGILEHPPLQNAYGTGLTSGTRVGNKNTMFGDGVQGSIDANGVVTINAPAKADQARSTTLHELQHAIQEREGFAKGGNSMMAFQPQNKEAFALLAQKRREMQTPLSLQEYTKQAWGMDAPTDEVRKAYADYVKTTRQASLSPAADRAAQEWAGKEYYHRLAGEAEARATQARMNMTPAERRAKFPYDSYDVPVDQLIIRDAIVNALRKR